MFFVATVSFLAVVLQALIYRLSLRNEDKSMYLALSSQVYFVLLFVSAGYVGWVGFDLDSVPKAVFVAFICEISHLYFINKILLRSVHIKKQIILSIHSVFLVSLGVALAAVGILLFEKIFFFSLFLYLAPFFAIFSLILFSEIISPILLRLDGARSADVDELAGVFPESPIIAEIAAKDIFVKEVGENDGIGVYSIGFPYGLPWRGGVVVTNNLFKICTEIQGEAVLAREFVQYENMNSLKSKIIPLMAFALFWLTGVIIFLVSLNFPKLGLIKASLGYHVFSLICVVLFFYCVFVLSRKIIRDLEVEADWVAVKRFEIDVKSYIDSVEFYDSYTWRSLKSSTWIDYFFPRSALPNATERERILVEFSSLKEVRERGEFQSLFWRTYLIVIAIWVLLAVLANPFIYIRAPLNSIWIFFSGA